MVERVFKDYGYPLSHRHNIIPRDTSTLFVCSGMQDLKDRFHHPDGTRDGSWQQCVRTIDLDGVGDGRHLSSFMMLGNFSFGIPTDYEISCEMWNTLMLKLGLRHHCTVRIHPDSPHRTIWSKFGYTIHDDHECVWSDGDIGGFCCELDYRGLEIGNLVNTLGHSTDVGFGWERLVQVCEGKDRVDETSLFRQDLSPILRDHVRTVKLMLGQGIVPGNKRREYVMRRVLRRCLSITQICPDDDLVNVWKTELELRENVIKLGQRMWKKHKHQTPEWWWSTFGLFPHELPDRHG